MAKVTFLHGPTDFAEKEILLRAFAMKAGRFLI